MSLAPQTTTGVPFQTTEAAIGSVRPVSLRSVLIGLALIPPNILWVVLMERVDGRAFSTTLSLFFTAVVSLLLLILLNGLLRRAAPRRALRQGEMLTIFSMLSIATAMAGIDLGMPLITLMGHPYWFATPDNRWESLFWQHLPSWLTVHDKEALRGYYLGNSTLYRWAAIKAWALPTACWAAFLMGLLWVMACLNTLLRAQWVDRERLSFPMVQLPIAMTAEEGGLFRSRLFWMGFAFAGGLSFVNGMHSLFPSLPAMTFNGFDALQWFPSRPWNAIGWTPLAIFPFIVGIGYLLPTDLLFSCWFFFLFWRMEKVVSSALGYMAEQPRFPYVDEQMFGAYMAICAMALWRSKSHLCAAWRIALQRAPSGVRNNPQDPMSYRAAFFGAAAGFLFLVSFAALAGLPVWLGVVFFTIYFAIAISVTRMRAELGPPTHDLHFIGPGQSLTTVFGTRNFSGGSLAVFTLFYWFNRAYRCHPMPHQLEGFKMAQTTRTSARSLLAAMGAAALLGIFMTFWVTLHVSYDRGAAARIYGWSSLGFGTEAYTQLASWLTSPTKSNPSALWAMGLGALIASLLLFARISIYGWPFHALGFALSGGWSMMWAWDSLFVAWMVKVCVLRYGGLRGYRTGLPFFFGIVLGDFLIGGLWTILGLLFNIPIYSLWSG